MPDIPALTRLAIMRYREEGMAATLQASLRYMLRDTLEKYNICYRSENGDARKVDFSSYPKPSQSLTGDYDIILVTDLRFPGGSTSSSAQEIATQRSAGLKTGLYHLPSAKMRHRSQPAPLIDKALKSGDADILNGVHGPLKTSVLLFRHPSILNPDGAELPRIQAGEVGLIVNHPPIKFGQIEYLLPYAIKKLRDAYGREPIIYPIGPLIRSALEEAYDGTLLIAQEDWVNVFDLDHFATERFAPIPHRSLRVGRHSRPNIEKWLADANQIRAAYPEQDGIEIHILGGADVPKKILGTLPANWTVHEFQDMDPAEFLRGIDVFVYFHHPDWIEAFGRVIVEAMAASLPVILPPHFKPLLGDAGIYCQPEQVSAELTRLRNPDYYLQKSRSCRDTALRRFSSSVHLERISALGDRDPTTAVITVNSTPQRSEDRA